MTISKLLSTKAIVKKGIPLGGTSALKRLVDGRFSRPFVVEFYAGGLCFEVDFYKLMMLISKSRRSMVLYKDG